MKAIGASLMINIGFLADYPHHQQQVIDWLWQAFGDGLSREMYASLVEHSLDKNALPLMFVALDGDRLVGTVGLWRCDLISRQDLFPWLAALYVDESYRNRRLGTALQRHVLEHCRRAGYRDLYLYTGLNGYYEKQGWNYIGEGLEAPDKRVRLYHQALSSSAE